MWCSAAARPAKRFQRLSMRTGNHIVRYEDLEARADNEREARMAAEARVRELEADLERHRQG